jgi:hypothetical protein
MTRQEAIARLDALNRAVATAAVLIEAERETLEQFFVEQERMASAGSVLDPTLFNSSERRAVEATVGPIYRAARDFANAYRHQLGRAADALAKVQSS